PGRSPEGREAMRKASRLASMVAQLKGVGPLTRDFARTVPLITPVEAVQIIELFDSCGIVGVRPLDGLAGGLALTVRADHAEGELRSSAEPLAQPLGRESAPGGRATCRAARATRARNWFGPGARTATLGRRSCWSMASPSIPAVTSGPAISSPRP